MKRCPVLCPTDRYSGGQIADASETPPRRHRPDLTNSVQKKDTTPHLPQTLDPRSATVALQLDYHQHSALANSVTNSRYNAVLVTGTKTSAILCMRRCALRQLAAAEALPVRRRRALHLRSGTVLCPCLLFAAAHPLSSSCGRCALWRKSLRGAHWR